MEGIHNLHPLKVIKAFERDGWSVARTEGSHHVLKKAGRRELLSIPVHGGKPIKQGLLRKQIKLAGLTVGRFLELYHG